MSTDTERMLHERLMRIEEKLDEITARLGEGSRRMDGMSRSISQHEAFGPRIDSLESTNKKALAAWGVITLVATAIGGVAWDWLKKKLGV